MMRVNFLLIFFGILLFGCSSKKSVLYLQDVDDSIEFKIDFEEYRLKTDDFLKIDIIAADPETVVALNKINPNISFNNPENYKYNGYQIDNEGYIIYPVVGKIKLLDLTLNEARDLILQKIIKTNQLINPVVDIKLISSYFVILGEVQKPGKYDYLQNELNILEAIGMAGDLTITGERTNIKLIRDVNNKTKVFNVDLTKSNFINEYFQIFSGDIIIVNPNRSRIKNAGIIGNSGTLLSLLSFILSSIIVITNS